jgi:hypothetical protein
MLLVAEQVPNDDWQLAPQKSLLWPQYPEPLQQSPKAEPLQVLPFFPQAPSVEMLSAAEHVPNEVSQPEPQ